MRRFLLPSLFAGCLLVSVPNALAEDREKAKQAMDAGAKALNNGKPEEAINQFLKALEYAPTASGPHRELGKAYETVGKYEDAKREYEKYLELKPTAPDSDQIRAFLQEVTSKIPAKTVTPPQETPKINNANGALSLVVNVEGAKISIDGKSIGKTPLKGDFSLASGEHQISIEKRGYETLTQSIDITSTRTLDLNLTLSKEGGSDSDGNPKYKRRGIAFLSVGAIGVLTGVGGGLGALDAQKDLDDLIADALQEPVEFLDAQDIIIRGQIFNVVTVAGYSVGALGIAGGTYYLLKNKKSDDNVKVEVNPTAGGAITRFSFSW